MRLDENSTHVVSINHTICKFQNASVVVVVVVVVGVVNIPINTF